MALLPVASILFIGSFLLGAGTLKDISLALFVGIAAGTYSSIFIATPLLVQLREREPELRAQAARVRKRREAAGAPAAAAPAAGGVVSVGAGAMAAGAVRAPSGGQRSQPKRKNPRPPGSKRR